MMADIKDISYNVRGLNDTIKSKRFLSLIHKLKTDILTIQEMHIKNTSNQVLKDNMLSYQLHSHGSSKARGTAILISRSVQFKELATLKDNEGRMVATKGILDGVPMTIVSLYAPNEG